MDEEIIPDVKIIGLSKKFLWKQLESRLKLLDIIEEDILINSVRDLFLNPSKKGLEEFKRYLYSRIKKSEDNLDKKIVLLQKYVCPELKLISPESIGSPDKDVMEQFLFRSIYLCFIYYIQSSNSLIKKFKNYIQSVEKTKEGIHAYVANKKPIKDFLVKIKGFLLYFYIYLLNKYTPSFYVHPVWDKNFKITGGTEIVTNDNNALLETLKTKMTEPFSENRYTQEQVKNMETILENKNINYLIKNNQISLSDKFSSLAESLKGNNNNNSLSKNGFFDFFSGNRIEDVEALYELYNKEEDKEKFLSYIVEKIRYYDKEHNNNNELGALQNIENIFDKILQSDFDKNSLNLLNDDIKFILLLETLDKLKNLFGKGDSSGNITVNIFSDSVKKTRINEEDTVEFS